MYKILNVAITCLIALGGAKFLGQHEEREDMKLYNENNLSLLDRSDLRRNNESLHTLENVPKIRAKRVIKGKRISIFEAPWSAHLRWLDENREPKVCSASIISENYLLTAGHCVCKNHTYSPPEIKDFRFTLRTGETTYFRGTKQEISEIICHPGYKYVKIVKDIYLSTRNVALLKLKSNLTFNSSQRPVSLSPLSAKYLPVNRTMNVSGWGTFSRSMTTNSNDLLGAQAKLVSKKDCDKMKADCGIDLNTMKTKICYKSIDDSYPYTGDDGSAVTVDGVQVGIHAISISSLEAMELAPLTSVFIDVSEFLPWIKTYTTPNEKSVQ